MDVVGIGVGQGRVVGAGARGLVVALLGQGLVWGLGRWEKGGPGAGRQGTGCPWGWEGSDRGMLFGSRNHPVRNIPSWRLFGLYCVIVTSIPGNINSANASGFQGPKPTRSTPFQKACVTLQIQSTSHRLFWFLP